MMKSFGYFLVAVAPLLAQQTVSPTINPTPSREFGQPQLLTQLISTAPNLVEGRELNSPVSMAFDNSVSPPILYVADTFNNRVLAFTNPNNFTACTVNGLASCGYATLAIGQPTGSENLQATLPGGPGSSLNTGLNLPTAVAVDSKGDLYVLDAGNNRVLRFPKPLTQPSTAPLPVDLVIGQATASSGRTANQGLSVPSAQTLSSLNGNQVPPFASLVFDPNGNLWVADPGNNRVLRFPVSQLQANTSLPTADVLLGQTAFNLQSLPNAPSGTPSQEDMYILYAPGGLAFDAAGDLFVSDNYSRVLYFQGASSFTSGETGLPAQRVLGLIVQVQGQPTVTYPNNYTLAGPTGLWTVGNNLFVADTLNNRVVEYDVPGNWPPAPSASQIQQSTEQISPPMLAVIGQTSFTAGSGNLGQANQGLAQPNSSTLSSPFGGASNGTDIWIADSGNNRVLSFVQQNASYSSATRLIGQLDYPYRSVNLIDGQEVYINNGSSGYGGVAVDYNSNPPHLYVADTLNNRVLGFNNAYNVKPGQAADLVIGQTAPYYSLINSPSNQPSQPSATGLYQPIGLTVDASGNLWVADSGNGRVVRFPAPFNQPAGSLQTATLVLGQAALTGNPVTDPSQSTMNRPWGVALFSECFVSGEACSVAVSDIAHNRVLIFKAQAGQDFQSGEAASIVLGQQNFNSTSPSTTPSGGQASTAGFDSPTHIAIDSSDRLYVCDTANSRVLVFTNTTNLANGSGAALPIYGLSNPQGIAIDPVTGEIWIANTNASQVMRLPEYQTLILSSNPNNPQATDTLYDSLNPLALAIDSDHNVIVLEAANRVSFYYGALTFQNAASYNQQPIAPGQLTFLYRYGLAFNLTPATASAYPWPTTLSGLQVLVNGVAAPIYRVDQQDIAFQVPTTSAIPQSGSANYEVVNVSTGEILAAGTFNMNPYNPAFFTSNSEGTGQVAAFNNDGTVNGPSNPVARGQIISLCLTGGGIFSGGPNSAPTDGQAPTGAAATSMQPVIGGAAWEPSGFAPASAIQYSGAGCGFPGGWQINLLVPQTANVGANTIVLTIDGYASSIGPAGSVGSIQPGIMFYAK